MSGKLYYWKPTGGYLYLVYWEKRWRFWGTGALAARQLSDFAKARGLQPVRIPGPKRPPNSVREAKNRFPAMKA